MKKNLIFTILPVSLIFLLMTTQSNAHTPRPTPDTTEDVQAVPTPDLTATDSAVQNIKERVEKVKQTTDPTVKGMMTALKQQKFGIVGTIEKIVGSSLQIRTPKGDIRLADLDRDATLLKGQRPISRDDVELNTPVIAMGFRQKDDSLLIRRLIITDESDFGTKRATLYGLVTTLTPKLLTILAFRDGGTSPTPIHISSKTLFFNVLNTTITRSDIKPRDPVVAVFPDTETATTSAQRVYSLSSKAVPTPSVSVVPSN